MPIYLLIDGIVLPGNGTGFGMPLDVVTESFSEVPDALAQFAPLSMSFQYVPPIAVLMHAGAFNLARNASVMFTDYNDVGVETMYMKFSLTNALISNFELTCGSTGMPYISMTFTWQTMQVQTMGAGGATETFSF